MDNKILVTWINGKTEEYTTHILAPAMNNEYVVKIVGKETGTIYKPNPTKKAYKIGFAFEVVRNKVTGIIDGVTTASIYNVVYYKNGSPFYRADVFEGTLTANLKAGIYKEV